MGLTTPWSARPSFPWLAIYFSGFMGLVLAALAWARKVGHELDNLKYRKALRRFQMGLEGMRWFIVVWFGFGLFGPAGWQTFVHRMLGTWVLLDVPHVRGPGQPEWVPLSLAPLLVGVMPALLTWAGLWWAQWPAERMWREQSLLDQLENDLPVHAPPTRGQFVRSQVRQQLLFLLLPVLMILALRDAMLVTAWVAKFNIGRLGDFENWVLLPSGAIVYLFAPSLLRRVLHTRPLEDSPLRRRLEAICRRMGLKYREILLWQTDYAMGNAAVMGLFPRVRYILLSDLLVESMTDEQIEAVFAHELGHVVHRHMAWYVAFFGMIVLAAVGVEFYVQQALVHLNVARWVNAAVLQMGLSLAGMMTAIIVVFGYLSRRFERQADVFAARMMQSDWSPQASHVGERGAGLFAGALRRVAAINNIPEERRSWCHGSIGKRARYVLELSADPSLTGQFDRLMSRLYLTLVTALLASGVIAWHVQGTVAKAATPASGREARPN